MREYFREILNCEQKVKSLFSQDMNLSNVYGKQKVNNTSIHPNSFGIDFTSQCDDESKIINF